MKKYTWAILYSILLISFTAYIALNTFVISDVYQTNAGQVNTAMFDGISSTSDTEDIENDTSSSASSGSGKTHSKPGKHKNENASSDVESDNKPDNTSDAAAENIPNSLAESGTYTDDNIKITLKEYNENNTRIYVADILLSSAQYLKTAFADDTYGRNVTERTSDIAQAHNAILAINGDFYGAQERGYVIRNGIVYRNTANGNDVLCIYADGSMRVVSSDDYTAEELAANNVWQAFSFGPGLVTNSEITVSENQEVGKAMASNPRTAIGIYDNNHFVFVVSDGRTDESEGLSLYQLATFMKNSGVKTAYNLDGGGSSTMYFNGSVVNNPTTGGRIKERKVSDIVYIG